MRMVFFQSKKSGPKLAVAIILLSVFCLLAIAAVSQLNDRGPFFSSQIAFAAEDGLYTASLTGGPPVKLVEGEGLSSPVFSSDGKVVAYLQNGDLYGYSKKSGSGRLLLTKALSYTGAGHGQFYASSSGTGVVQINAATGKTKTILPPEPGKTFQNLSLSPNGRLLAYSINLTDTSGGGGVYVYNLGTKKSILAAEGTKSTDAEIGKSPVPGKWSPDSRTLFVWLAPASASLSADGVHYALFDAKTKKLTASDEFALMYNENVSFSARKTFAILSGTDRILYNSKRIELVDYRSGLAAKTVPTQGLAPATPFLSPDETRLLFSGVPEDYRTYLSSQIYLLLNGKRYQLTNATEYGSLLPQFLKNNNYILFARVTADGKFSVWRMDSAGKDEVQLAGWIYANPLDPRGADYFGRIDWSRMFTVYDDTKPKITIKSP